MNADELYALLPAVYRIRDVEQGGALRELVDVIAAQVSVLEESLDQFYDDQFVETCAEWITPYIGDLVGYRALHGVVPSVASPRAEVANTIRFRRRKGTASMLEQLARDVTGWPARVVEFFERLVDSQYMNHVRMGKGGTPDLRDTTALEWVGTAFDDLAHTAEVRRISTGAGRYNIPNVGIFLWRVAAIPLFRSPLSTADGTRRRFRFDPLGTDQPIYAQPRTEVEITHLAEPFDVPLALSRRWLSAHLGEYLGPDLSLWLEVDGGAVPATVRVCDLSDTGGGWNHEPASGSDTVSIDPVLGRVCFADPVAAEATPLATFRYGRALDAVGGGGYDRGDPAPSVDPPETVEQGATIQTALNVVAGGGIVEIVDSWRYEQTPVVVASDGAHVTLRSANRQRPTIVAEAPIHLDAGPGSTVVLEGLLLAGGPVVLDEQDDDEPRHVILRHCTLVPGLTRTSDNEPVTPDAASLLVLHPFATVTLERCILGPIVAVEGATLTATDCVIDAGDQEAIAYAGRPVPTGGGLRVVTSPADVAVGDGLTPGAALTFDECTVVGRVHATQVDISNSLLLGTVRAQRRQVGCVRFSYVTPESRTPMRYECEPQEPSTRPHFTSLRFGDPGYAQLRATTPEAIMRGADDEGEMGVAHYLFQPQREANLRIRLDEYLRFGLEAGPIYAS